MRLGVSMTAAGLDVGKKRMEWPNVWPALFPNDLPIFLSSASAKRGVLQLLGGRAIENAAPWKRAFHPSAALVRWSARVGTEVGAGVKGYGDGDGFLILPSEAEGHMLRAGAGAPGPTVSEQETERRPLWRKGESAAAGMTERPE
ncbi:hypothetical protein ZWY2020_004196 [Hordeum vulgare]|nr:hypothetical protein ZWY2020_004196 [Hordeum vulgare]